VILNYYLKFQFYPPSLFILSSIHLWIQLFSANDVENIYEVNVAASKNYLQGITVLDSNPPSSISYLLFIVDCTLQAFTSNIKLFILLHQVPSFSTIIIIAKSNDWPVGMWLYVWIYKTQTHNKMQSFHEVCALFVLIDMNHFIVKTGQPLILWLQ